MTRGLARVDIQSNAAKFAEQYKSAHYERGEAQTFYNDFFRVFGIERFGNAVFERYVRKVDGRHHGYIDLLWPKVLLAEHKSVGRDLRKALEQAEDYLIELPGQDRPQCMLACDFQNFLLVDLDTEEKHEFRLAELPAKIDLFDFMRGRKRRGFSSQAPVSVKAAGIMGDVYDALRDNGYRERDAARLLTKLTFCFFADDTGIFSPRGILLDYLENTSDDGADLGPRLVDLFDVLNTPKEKRQKNLPAELQQFEHVNGDLFGSLHATPRFDAKTRAKILQAAEFNWEPVSPAIFGSLFQSVMSPRERHDSGAHYTTEENIMKVVGPLFLDGLRAEFDRIKARGDAGRKNALDKFRKKLAGLKFLDPACGAGNFLIVSYKQLRRLELDAIKETYPPDPKTERFDAAGMPLVNVDQFCGIEINRFSAKIAEAAMWMMDHLMNNEISSVYGDSYVRLPLKERANVMNADALEIDWGDVLPAAECSYILGNPPFGGSRIVSGEQKAQIKRVTGKGRLDYVAAWFVKAVKYAPDAPLGLVATNSITQGEQVGQLWPMLLKDGREITFAHRSFRWESDAAGKAHVHVVVIGMGKQRGVDKALFGKHGGTTTREQHAHISPYMVGCLNELPIVASSDRELNGLPDLAFGTQPIDGGHYIFTDRERDDFLKNEPRSEKFFARFVNAKELINGSPRWILDLHGAEPSELRSMPHVRKRVEEVKEFREASGREATRELAKTPTEFAFRTLTTKAFLAVPRVSSENRQYVPMDFVQSDVITSDSTMIIREPTIQLFGLLTSKMHMFWLAKVGGRLKGDYRYSASVVYNTFPVPDNFDSLAPHAQSVLDMRERHAGQTLADLYDPNLMPADLRRAHEKLDKAVDRLYRKEPFKDDHERLEFLLERYGAMVQKNQKLIPGPKRRRRRAKRRARPGAQ